MSVQDAAMKAEIAAGRRAFEKRAPAPQLLAAREHYSLHDHKQKS